MTSMQKEYGQKRGQNVFYASANKGTIKGVEGASKVPDRKKHKRKSMYVFIAFMLMSTQVFAMASKPKTDSWLGCLNRPYAECPSQNKAMPWLDPNWMVCANRIYDQCRCQHRPDLVKYNSQSCDVVNG